MRKYEYMTELYNRTCTELSTPTIWMTFLDSACRNYKLDFDEQVMVFAQRPEATALLELEDWNKLFHRWVNRGATGIAVFDKNSPGKQRLKYYFDVADTHEGNKARQVPLWNMQEEYSSFVIETLENTFGGLENKDTLASAILSAAQNATQDSSRDYLEDMLGNLSESMLDGLSKSEVEQDFNRLLTASASYMMMKRCGLDPRQYFDTEDFRPVTQFSSQHTLNGIGSATSAISEMALREIASTVLNIEKQEIRTIAQPSITEYAKPIEIINEPEERMNPDEQSELYHAGRLQSTEFEPATSARNDHGQIRTDAPEVPAGEQESNLHDADYQLHTEPAFTGDTANSDPPNGAIDTGNGAGTGRERRDENEQPNAVGGADEQHSAGSRGDNLKRGGVQLTPLETGSNRELSPFLEESLILGILQNPYDDLQLKKEEILSYFLEHTQSYKRAVCMKDAYPKRYTGLIIEEQEVGYVAEDDGLVVWRGKYLTRSEEGKFSWGIVADLTAQLIEQHEYITAKDISNQPRKSGQQMSFFDAGSMEYPVASPENQLSFFKGFTISQQVIDEALCLGGNNPQSLERICAHFAKDYPLQQNASFLQEEYGVDGKGFYSNNHLVSLWFDENGIRIAEGKTSESVRSVLVNWEDAATRVRELLDMGRYAPQDILENASHNEIDDIAANLWYVVQDFSEEAHSTGYLPTVESIYKNRGGFPANTEEIAILLQKEDSLEQIRNEMALFVEAYQKDPTLQRFRWSKCEKALRQLEGLQRHQLNFTSQQGFVHEPRQFITNDEIDRLLLGAGNTHQAKFRIYSYFLQENTAQERIAFLKNEYGTGGSGRLGFNENHDSKGIEYSRGTMAMPYDKVLLKWPQVEKRIGELIKKNRYLSEKELAKIPEYEKNQLARSAYYFFSGLPNEQPRPYPSGEDHYTAIPTLEKMMESPEKVTDLVSQMKEVWENTPLLDRHYDQRKKAYENMLAFQEGTFSLFAGKHHAVEVTEELPTETEKEEKNTIQEDSIGYSEELEEENNADSLSKEAFPKPVLGAVTTPKPRVNPLDAFPDIPMEERLNYKIRNDQLGTGSPKEKFKANIEALRLSKQLTQQGRLATKEEQETLAQYVGWGGLSEAFDESNTSWAAEYKELHSLLSPEEYESARATVLNAHYTSPVVIKAIYKAVENMGFTTGNILDPGCGIGNFQGLLPESMSDSKVFGVEIDPSTGKIAQQLYQKNSIAIQGYEASDLPDSFFDLAIGNVPFGNYGVADRRYDKHKFLIHDYFFGKTLDKVRPGGIVAFITSKGTMDKKNPAVRKYIAQRSDLLGAIRLPNNAFLANAGAEVTSDILFLQKRDRLVDIEQDWVHLETDENGIQMNSYFTQHPEMILGEMVMESGPFGQEPTCKPYENSDLSELLAEAIQNIHAEYSILERSEENEEQDLSIPADPSVRNFSFTTKNGQIYYRENSRMNPVQLSLTAQNRVKGMIEIRDCVRHLIELQTEDKSIFTRNEGENTLGESTETEIATAQKKLGLLYDAFTKKYGLINSRANNTAFSEDSSYCLLCSLEILNENGELARKADMFTKRTIKPHTPVLRVDTASEALAVSIGERACVDIDFMAALTGKAPSEIEQELAGVIFRVPEQQEDTSPTFQTADEYLSGNVREKLEQARAVAENNPLFESNVSALEKVQPVDLSASEINVRLGSTWVPADVVRQFIFELLSSPNYVQWNMKVNYSPYTSEWNITNKSSDSGNVKAYSGFGTSRINAYKIIEETLNLRDVRVFDYIEEDGKRKPLLNKKETAIAQAKQDLIKSKFEDWLWEDPQRREKLVQIYNDKFNSIRPREYDGSHIQFVGMNPEISLRPHQVNAVARSIYGGNTLLAHVVGAGKTFEMIAIAMETKRLGLCSKSMFVVPNHLTEQMAAECLQLYPSANILVATRKDFETKNRKKFCGRIATGDFDAVIIGHSQFEKIPMSVVRQCEILKQEKEEIIQGISELKRNHGERFSIKQLEKTKKAIDAKLEKLNDQSRKDDVVTFEELGVDRIFIDESHYFKNRAKRCNITCV